MPYADPDLRRKRDRDRVRQRTAERIAQGLCPRYGNKPPVPGRSLCGKCGEKRRLADRARAAKRRRAGIKRVRDAETRKAEYQRARQRAEARLARGVCAKCGRDPHEPGRRLCATCGERQRRRDRERYAKARAANRPYGGRNPETKRAHARRRTRNRQRARRAAGLCIRCGIGSPVEGGSSCEACLAKRRAGDRETYAARRAAGLCTRCGAPSFDGAPVCGPCTVLEDRYRDARNEAARIRYAERRARERCTHCGTNPTFGASRCETCAQQAYARSEHVRGLPVYSPSFTVIELDTGEPLGVWERWEDVVLCLSFARLSFDDVEILHEHAPMQPELTGLT